MGVDWMLISTVAKIKKGNDMNKISKLIVATTVVACVIGGVSVSAHAEGFKLPRGTGTIAKFIWKTLTCDKCMGLGKAKNFFGYENTCPKCGGNRTIQVRMRVCDNCCGLKMVQCTYCGGNGGAWVPGPFGPIFAPCQNCGGNGWVGCLRCMGQGVLQE